MDIEQHEILTFLRGRAAFAGLAEPELERVARAVDVSYFRAGTRILEAASRATHWYLIRSGAVEISRRSGELHSRLAAGDHFGESALLRDGRVRFPATAIEDTLCYLLPASLFAELFEAHDAFADEVEIEDRSRLRLVATRRGESDPLATVQAGALLDRAALTVGPQATVLEAARRMTDEGVSSLLVTKEAADGSPPRVVGIVTDRDLRARLVAAGRGLDTPVVEIMSEAPVVVAHDEPAFEAQLLMLRHRLHHLPVLREGRPIGVVSMSDLLRLASHHSLFLVGAIARQDSVDGLAALVDDVHASFTRMAGEDASARIIGGALAAIGRSFKRRLLELAQADLGPPPVPCSLLALGSMARHEQLIVTDQDNALLLGEGHDPGRHDAYFQALADFVCNGLARCGYPRCSGGIMAANPAWRLTRQQWQATFDAWIDRPTPESLLHAGIFFDLDAVAGNAEGVDALVARIARKAQASPRFLACMARNALQRTPPLGFFKDFVVESDGRQTNVINLKRRGTAPLVDLVRVHALAVGSTARSTYERLRDVIDAGVLPPGRGPDLHDALEFIAGVRVRHQAEALRAGVEPDNSIQPESLSEFERKTLRDAFRVLEDAQRFLRFRYQPGRAN